MKKAIVFWWNYFWMMTIQNPKSTWSGVFSFIGLSSLGLVALFAPDGPLAQLGISTVTLPAWLKFVLLIATFIGAIFKFFTLAVSADPGKQLAKVPGISKPQVEDSHETPDNPKAKAVKLP